MNSSNQPEKVERPLPLALVPDSVLGLIRPPYVARVAAGAAVYAYEESMKLPSRIVMLPMNVVSQLIQTSMHVQQFLSDLAVKGDDLFSTLGLEPTEAKPEWATFDDDEINLEPVDAPAGAAGRFALYSTPVDAPKEKVVTPILEAATSAVPAIVDEIDYESLTLAQLRARLKGLSTHDLSTLLGFEYQSRNRDGFAAMLSERIATLDGK